MPGLTNYYRAKIFATLSPGDSIAGLVGLFVSLLTAAPSHDGTTGGVTDETEWGLDRIQLNQEGPTEPYASVSTDGDTGGVKLVNVGEIEWDEVDTAELLEDTTIVAAALYDSLNDGIMIAWDYLLQERTFAPGAPAIFQTGDFRVRMFGTDD